MRILLVEDDELVAEALVKDLTNQNYAVDVAADGQAGWELVDAFTYDLILLDVNLPKLDGITLCRRLRSSCSSASLSQGLRIPILLLTAQDSSSDKVMGLDAGADDYLTKPFNKSELLLRINTLLKLKQAEEKLYDFNKQSFCKQFKISKYPPIQAHKTL